ncbi:MAG: DUF1934 domain-containing protein [Lactobacillaceae bacterium]|jgi:uncharacterized beta-barrel protein YwiB (DUF1934 family)|nr:DUF1934 domain-containing protein [Lactobacillaceae bacterium]
MQKVNIKLSSLIDQNGLVDNVHLETPGTWDEKTQTLAYEQNDLKNELQLSGNEIILRQPNGTEIVFRHEDTSESLFGTPYGQLPIVVTTERALYDLGDDKSSIDLSYQILQNDMDLGKFSLKLEFENLDD